MIPQRKEKTNTSTVGAETSSVEKRKIIERGRQTAVAQKSEKGKEASARGRNATLVSKVWFFHLCFLLLVYDFILDPREASLQRLNLFRVLALICGTALVVVPLHLLDLLHLRLDLVVQVADLLLELPDVLVVLGAALLPVQRLPHAEGHGALVQGLVCGKGHSHLVADAEQRDPPFRANDRDLSEQLIEALRVELLADRTDAGRARVLLLQAHVQGLLKLDDVHRCCGDRGDVLHPDLAIFFPISSRQDGVQDLEPLFHGQPLVSSVCGGYGLLPILPFLGLSELLLLLSLGFRRRHEGGAVPLDQRRLLMRHWQAVVAKS